MLQHQEFGAWQSNPIVVDGIMYVTERPNDVVAVDAVTGRVFWVYRLTPAGQRALARERREWGAFSGAVDAVLGTP